jgi:hypothetical protein
MADDLTPLAPHGRRPDAPRNERGQYVSEPKNAAVKSGGNGRTYIIRRLARDGRTELVAMVRSGRMSAYEAAKRAGYGGTSHRPKPSEPPQPSIADFVKALIG